MGILRNVCPVLIVFWVSFLWLAAAALASQKSYIVYFGGHSHGSEATLADYERVRKSHYEFLGSFLESKTKAHNAIFYSYTYYINGFAANLEEEEVLRISRDPSVLSVFENKVLELHTTRSWGLLELERDGRVPVDSIWTKARFGQGAIIANLDTGVWPESESFNDKGMGPVPSRWKGFCQNGTKHGVPCNRKLIGARYFNRGSNLDYNSARDTDGHGTHTLSTAGGRFVVGASIFGYANGTAKGGSPNAHVAAYKVCSSLGCYSADILAGFDAAIHDGVDVLSVSLGGISTDYLSDAVAIGSFHAMANGITIVCSAGNDGPIDGSVSNVAPWLLTVGASTMDRDFPVYVSLGNKKRIKGQSLSSARLPRSKFYPMIDAKDAKALDIPSGEAELCVDKSLDPKKVKGKIVVCLRGFNGRVEKGEAVLKAGGIGMILANDETTGNDVLADAHVLPAAHITYSDGMAVYSYLNSTKSPMSYISAPSTQYGVKPAPYMAGFSSRGPNLINMEILKPDITAPGVNILAAFTEATGPTDTENDNRRVPFNVESGTSMACPHVSGIAGLLKTLYPYWSPAAFRSAIVTTAKDQDNMGQPIKDFSFKESTPFAYGAGIVRANRAMDPGLIYDLSITDYLNFLCAIGYNSSQIALFLHKPYVCPHRPMNLVDLNYPSISIPLLSSRTTVYRTLKNVGTPSKYKVHIKGLEGVSTSVRPSVLQFNKIGEEKTFEITLVPKKSHVETGFSFGKMIWSDGKHYVRSPLVVNLAS